uniref:Polymerase/histidinol phosphatase N-terminal domain-containing protein n=1 Tax=Aegilops tauschii subsp. strangulata TaxID=200361 RepID=A0A453IS92_AEGTS
PWEPRRRRSRAGAGRSRGPALTRPWPSTTSAPGRTPRLLRNPRPMPWTASCRPMPRAWPAAAGPTCCLSFTPTPTIATGSFPPPLSSSAPTATGLVKVLALTDHDTMAGIPEAMSAAHKCGIRIIPGVEISALHSPREIPGAGEPVHILAYYGMCGPSRFDELDNMLLNIREGRYLRAKNMLAKLNSLKVPIKWEHVTKIAGEGVAPGRLHIARALVEAGYVDNVRQAFNKYLGNDGPAYATGSEPFTETVVQMISRTGGISALAHPWSLKNPDAVIRSLKGAGLHAMEVYRSDGKVDGFSQLAEKYGLLKLGGSDFHGKGTKDETDVGEVKLAITTLCSFLEMARPIWCSAMKDILLKFAEEPSAANLGKTLKFGQLSNPDGFAPIDSGTDVVNLCLSSWLSYDDMEDVELEEVRSKLVCYAAKT